MFYSIKHWQPLVNGASGYISPAYREIHSEARHLPFGHSVEYFSALGVKLLIVHTGQFAAETRAFWSDWDLSPYGLQRWKRFGNDIVFKIAPVKTTSDLQSLVALPSTARPKELVYGSVTLKGKEWRTWVHPQPIELSRIRIEWDNQSSGKKFKGKQRLFVPLVIFKNESITVDLAPLHVPSTPGRYTLKIIFPWGSYSQNFTVYDSQSPPQAPKRTGLRVHELRTFCLSKEAEILLHLINF